MDQATTLMKTTTDISDLAKQLGQAHSIILSTHKQCDGDGLGAILGLYHVLKHTSKNVRVMLIDEIPRKYSFLEGDRHADIFENPHEPIQETDLCLIFDTNDKRLVSPLYETLEINCKKILFVDHHPVLNQGPPPTQGSYINTNAASTGEIAFLIIDKMGLTLNAEAARALYTSICFDTQLFRYVKSRPTSHLVAAELLKYETNPESIHKEIFSTYTVDKMKFLSEVLGKIEYFREESIAVLNVSYDIMQSYDIDIDDTRDVVDMIMNVTSVETAALFREDAPGFFKLSLRSKGALEVLSIAENFGGGGHKFAAGAPMKGDYEVLKQKVLKLMLDQLSPTSKARP